MKKIMILLSVVLLSLSLSACVKNDNKDIKNMQEEKLSIMSTIFPYYDFSKEIAKDNANISMLLNPGSESHTYEPTPKDIKDIQNADLFIYTGGENDVWVENILNSMGDKKPKTLRVLDYVLGLEEEIVDGMEHNHEEEHSHKEDSHEEEGRHKDIGKSREIDEHIWTSPKNAMLIVEKIAETMEKEDKENAEIYKENTKIYIEKLEKLDEKYRKIVENSNNNTIIFGDRFPFRYLAEEYDLDYYAPFSGCSTETEASASTVAFLIDKTKQENIPIIFSIEQSDGKIADTIAEATGAKRLMLHSAHNITKEEKENGKTYLSIMEENAKNLEEALG